ncbi:MAG: DUF460 domain-containing protein, partial [Sulfolobaceae archaeon]
RIDEIKMMYNKELQKERKIYELKLEIENYIKLINTMRNKIEEKERETKNLLEIIEGLVNSRLLVVGSDQLPPYMKVDISEKRVYFHSQQVDNSIVKLFLRDKVIVEKETLRDLEILNKEKLLAESEKLDLKRILEDYRRNRFRTK